MCAMLKTCRPIWKRQARETSPYMSGTDLRQSVAFRWRILPRLSRCCANQERCPDRARLTDVGARVPVFVVNTGRSALQNCKSCEFLVLPQEKPRVTAYEHLAPLPEEIG